MKLKDIFYLKVSRRSSVVKTRTSNFQVSIQVSNFWPWDQVLGGPWPGWILGITYKIELIFFDETLSNIKPIQTSILSLMLRLINKF